MKFNVTLSTCCDRPSVAVMDHNKHSPADWNNPQPTVNRMCLRCGVHWYGPVTNVQRFTRKQWNTAMEAAA